MNNFISPNTLPTRRSGQVLRLLAVAAGLASMFPASAWDGYVTGTIIGLDTVANEPNNYEVRVYISGASTVCTSTSAAGVQGFAYMNSADNNFKATLAGLMLAYSTGKTVSLFTMNDNNAGCHLHYVQIRG